MDLTRDYLAEFLEHNINHLKEAGLTIERKAVTTVIT
jgi:biotin operon repressor